MGASGGPPPVSMAEARLIQRLRRGEPAAWEALWGAWRDRCWSVVAPMGRDRAHAVALLAEVYRTLPGVVRSWSPGTPLYCLVGVHTYTTVAAAMELGTIDGIDIGVPTATHTPSADDAVRTLASLPDHVRLVYLLDLFFGCPAGTTATLAGVDELDLRHARARAAYAIVAGSRA